VGVADPQKHVPALRVTVVNSVALFHPSGVGKWVVIHVIRYIDYGAKAKRVWLRRSMTADCILCNIPLARAMDSTSLRRVTTAGANQLPFPRL